MPSGGKKDVVRPSACKLHYMGAAQAGEKRETKRVTRKVEKNVLKKEGKKSREEC